MVNAHRTRTQRGVLVEVRDQAGVHVDIRAGTALAQCAHEVGHEGLDLLRRRFLRGLLHLFLAVVLHQCQEVVQVAVDGLHHVRDVLLRLLRLLLQLGVECPDEGGVRVPSTLRSPQHISSVGASVF